MNNLLLSMEFFPPKTSSGLTNLLRNAEHLTTFCPQLYTVTYGAGGATRDNTLATALAIHAATQIPIAPHITGISSSRETIDALLDQYQAAAIRRLVVLRGDLSRDEPIYGDFNYAHELVAYIRQRTGNYFTIAVACYPDYHPAAISPQADIDNLQRKIDAGADYAITQYFYNTEAYIYLHNECQRRHMNIPLIPGIMPITQLDNLLRFSKLCGAELPQFIHKNLIALQDDKIATANFGLTIVTQLCQRLLDYGAPGLHFYTLNQAEPTMMICQQLAQHYLKK